MPCLLLQLPDLGPCHLPQTVIRGSCCLLTGSSTPDCYLPKVREQCGHHHLRTGLEQRSFCRVIPPFLVYYASPGFDRAPSSTGWEDLQGRRTEQSCKGCCLPFPFPSKPRSVEERGSGQAVLMQCLLLLSGRLQMKQPLGRLMGCWKVARLGCVCRSADLPTS